MNSLGFIATMPVWTLIRTMNASAQVLRSLPQKKLQPSYNKVALTITQAPRVDRLEV